MFKLKPPVMNFLEQFCSVRAEPMNHSEIFRMTALKEHPDDADIAEEQSLRVKIFTLPNSFRIKEVFVGYPTMNPDAEPCVIEFVNKNDEIEFPDESQARQTIEDEILYISSAYQLKFPWSWSRYLWRNSEPRKIITAALDALAGVK